jgi:hypothetical protein
MLELCLHGDRIAQGTKHCIGRITAFMGGMHGSNIGSIAQQRIGKAGHFLVRNTRRY